MEQVSRQRRSESAWRALVGRQAGSGLTVKSFCEREGINAASLYGWRSRLRDGAPRASAARSTSASKAARLEKSPAEFLDLGALATNGSRFEVRLDLGGGVLLHLVRG